MKHRTPFLFLIVSALSGLIGCAASHTQAAADTQPGGDSPGSDTTPAGGKPQKAIAIIRGAGDNRDKITGIVTFTRVELGVAIVADVDGLSPGKHGIHIHEKPDLSDPHLASAGGHFNPEGQPHGGPDDPNHSHAGDLGNIEVDDKGHGHLEMRVPWLRLDGSHNVIGHSVIIHAHEDDLRTQPSGKSGERIAGGAIVEKDDK